MPPKRANVSAAAMQEKPDLKTVKRLLHYVFAGGYGLRLVLVVICIILSVLASVAASVFIQVLIDDYIIPLMGMAHPVFTGLIRALVAVGFIYLVGVFAGLAYNRMMVTISQGVLKQIRDDLFAHMQTLPIRYFDRNSHGDMMSYFTNDTDTLRQFISQSLPQLFMSCLTIITVF